MDRIRLEHEARANQLRREAANPHQGFVPYFREIGAMPPHDEPTDETRGASPLHHRANHMRPEQAQERHKHLPRIPGATMSTYEIPHDYQSPFYPPPSSLSDDAQEAQEPRSAAAPTPRTPQTTRRENTGMFSTDTPRLASAGRYTSNLEVVEEAANNEDPPVQPNIRQRAATVGKQAMDILKSTIENLPNRKQRSATMKSAGTMMSKLSVRTMKGVLYHPTSKAKVRIQSWGSSPHSQKLKMSSARGTRYEDRLDNAGGSFRVGRVAKIEPHPALHPQEDVREQAEKTQTRRRGESTAATALGDVKALDQVNEPKDQMESRERSDEEGGKGNGKDPVRGVVSEDNYIEIGRGRYEWVPASAILDGLPLSVNEEVQMETTCCQSAPSSPDDDEEDAMKPTRKQTASPSLDEDRDLQMAFDRSRNPSQNVVPASVFGQAGPGPCTAAHWAGRDEEASCHPHFEGLDGADDRPVHPNKRSGDEEDQPPRKRRKVSEAIKEASAATQGGGQGTKRKVEAESEEQARKKRAGERNEPETMEDDLEWAERMDGELAASVARRRRDEAGAMGLDGAMSSSLRRRRDDGGEEDGGRRPSRIHRDRRARWEADQADLKAARVDQERLRREDQRLNSEAFEGWMAEKHGENVAPGQTPTFRPTLANQWRNAEAVERMRVMIESHEAEEKDEAQARAEVLGRQGEAQAALEHLREVTAGRLTRK